MASREKYRMDDIERRAEALFLDYLEREAPQYADAFERLHEICAEVLPGHTEGILYLSLSDMSLATTVPDAPLYGEEGTAMGAIWGAAFSRIKYHLISVLRDYEV